MALARKPAVKQRNGAPACRDKPSAPGAALDAVSGNEPVPVRRERAQRPEPLPRLLTVDEVAKICRQSVRSVRRWIADGELAVYRIGGRVLVSEEDLAAFIRSCRG